MDGVTEEPRGLEATWDAREPRGGRVLGGVTSESQADCEDSEIGGFTDRARAVDGVIDSERGAEEVIGAT